MELLARLMSKYVCAQSNVFCSEPPKGGGVSIDSKLEVTCCLMMFIGLKTSCGEPYCYRIYHDRYYMMNES